MKKLLTVSLLILFALSLVFAGDFKFLFTELDQHMDLLSGFLPTLITIGESYEGLELMDGNLTQIQATIGGGLSSRALFRNPRTGEALSVFDFDREDLRDNALLFDAWQIRWNLKFLQGFGDSWVPNKDLITVYAGYEGRWEKYVDYLLTKGISLPKNKENLKYLGSTYNGSDAKSPVQTIDEWFDLHNDPEITPEGFTRNDSSVYPDMAGDSQNFTSFYTGVVLNTMMDDNYNMKGAKAEIKFQFAPGFANKAASYYSATLNAVGGYTLFRIQQPSGYNLFSVSLKDRLNFNWTDGEKVPVYASSPVSLGRKVRGFNTNSYATNFTVVNNFDIRLAGPEAKMNELFPRINLFFDAGYHAGNCFNTKIKESNFLCSTGFEAEMCFWGICDIGIQYSYLIHGNNLREPKNNLIMGATFFLDF